MEQSGAKKMQYNGNMYCAPSTPNMPYIYLYMPEQDQLKTCSVAADQKFKARQMLGLTRELHLLAPFALLKKAETLFRLICCERKTLFRLKKTS